jgi:protoporphyrinogen oxidase
MNENKKNIIIVGAGPAGLTAGYLLSQHGYKVKIFESSTKYVGGISRTEEYKGFRFDIGGHRFFSKSKEINNLWSEILPINFQIRKRKSRIYFKNKFFNYPLDLMEVVFKLGFFESLICLLSFIKAKLLPIKKPKSYHDWIYNNFGERLYINFFKSYTEKVWGISCDDISADWAAQRIKGLSIKEIILKSILKPFKNNKVIKTLIDEFKYPDLGPGMMWDAAKNKIEEKGSKIYLDHKVIKYNFEKNKNQWQITTSSQNELNSFTADIIINSSAMRDVVQSIEPQMKNLSEANKLKYRDYITVAVMMKKEKMFSDNWVYIHDPNIIAGRMQNYTAWSEKMSPDRNKSCLGLEYFCSKDDNFWSQSDEKIVDIAKSDLKKLNLVNTDDIIDFHVVRQEKAYPIYDDNYKGVVEKISAELKENYKNFYMVGRNGMHKYNNQDHSMMTSILTVENILYDSNYDTWKVNEDAEYHENTKDSDERKITLNSLRNVPLKKSD